MTAWPSIASSLPCLILVSILVPLPLPHLSPSRQRQALAMADVVACCEPVACVSTRLMMTLVSLFAFLVADRFACCCVPGTGALVLLSSFSSPIVHITSICE